VYNAQKEWDKAIADCTEASRLKPDHPPAYRIRATANKSKGNLDQALLDIQQAIRHDPKNAYSFAVIGDIYYQLKKWIEALGAYQHCLELPPSTENRANIQKRIVELMGKRL